MAYEMTTADFIRSLMPGVDKTFGEEVNVDQYHRMMFRVDTGQAGQAQRIEAGHSGYPMFVEKPESMPMAGGQAGQEHTWIYNPTVWALMVAATRELMEDTSSIKEASNLVFKNTKGLAISARATWESLAAFVYNNGFDTNYVMPSGSDGQPMFSATHPSKVTGRNISNVLATPAQLSEAALEDMAVQVMSWDTSYGIKSPRKLKNLIVAPGNWFESHRLLESLQRTGTPNNDTNAIKDLNIIKDTCVNPYLISPTAWFCTTDAPVDSPVIKVWRDIKIEDEYNDHSRHVAYVTASFRVAMGWTGSQGVIGTPGY